MLTIHQAHEFDDQAVDPLSGQRVDDGARRHLRTKRTKRGAGRAR